MTNGYDEAPRPPQPPAAYQPPPAQYGPSKGYIGMIIIGVFILLIGGIVGVSHGFLNDPMSPDSDDYDNYSDYEKAQKNYRNDMEAFKDNGRVISTLGNIIQYVGLILLGVGMVLGSLRDTSLSPNIRLGMLLALAIIIGFKIGGSVVQYYF
jgi:hypothetical protein